jgi:hypothetical protein
MDYYEGDHNLMGGGPADYRAGEIPAGIIDKFDRWVDR